MKIDYSKNEFSSDEKEYLLNEAKVLNIKNPNFIPIIIQLDSNVLSIEKHKFLVPDNITYNNFINTILKKKLKCNNNFISNSEILLINVVNGNKLNSIKEPQLKNIKDFYLENHDEETNLLILRVSRQTSYKYLKKSLLYFIGY